MNGESLGNVLSMPGGPPTHTTFEFDVEDKYLKEIKVGDFIATSKEIGKEYIGIITKPEIFRPQHTDPALRREYLERGISPEDVLTSLGSYNKMRARIVGVWDGSMVIFDGSTPDPGAEVYKVSSKKLSRILNFVEEGISLGYLFLDPQERVVLDPDRFINEHSYTFGVTRWGKSYTIGVILEEISKKGKPVLVIDPHGEYYSLAEANDKEEEIKKLPEELKPTGFNTLIYSPPMFREPHEKELTIRFSELRAPEIIELTRITGENQIAVVYETVRSFGGSDYDLQEFISRMRRVKEELGFQASIQSVIARLEVLQRGIGVFGEGFDPTEIIKGGQITIINLGGLDLRAQQVTVAALLRRLLNERQFGNIPGFATIVDEGQRFAPEGGEAVSKTILERIVTEGLKFGVSLHIIAQRPTEVSNTIRSESETKIFHKLTEVSEVNYATGVLQVTAPELAENIPRLGVGEAVITGSCTNGLPIRVNIRARQSKHAGRTGAMRRRVAHREILPRKKSIKKKGRKDLRNYN